MHACALMLCSHCQIGILGELSCLASAHSLAFWRWGGDQGNALEESVSSLNPALLIWLICMYSMYILTRMMCKSAGQQDLYHQSSTPMRQDTAFTSQASASPAQALQQQSSWGASPLGNHGSIWSSTPSERCTSMHGPEVYAASGESIELGVLDAMSPSLKSF